jgi:HK97 gp10 family phage protein
MAAVNSIKLDTRELDRLTAQLEPKAEQLIAATAHQVEAVAKTRVPVDTGNLKSSIQASKAGRLRWLVSAAAEYAVYVELGTGRRGAASSIQRPEGIAYAVYWAGMAARPFLIPAVEGVRAKFSQMWAELFK